MKPYIQSYCQSIQHTYNYSILLMNRRSKLMGQTYECKTKKIKQQKIISKITNRLHFMKARLGVWLNELKEYGIEIHNSNLGTLKIPYIASTNKKVGHEFINPQ